MPNYAPEDHFDMNAAKHSIPTKEEREAIRRVSANCQDLHARDGLIALTYALDAAESRAAAAEARLAEAVTVMRMLRVVPSDQKDKDRFLASLPKGADHVSD